MLEGISHLIEKLGFHPVEIIAIYEDIIGHQLPFPVLPLVLGTAFHFIHIKRMDPDSNGREAGRKKQCCQEADGPKELMHGVYFLNSFSNTWIEVVFDFAEPKVCRFCRKLNMFSLTVAVSASGCKPARKLSPRAT